MADVVVLLPGLMGSRLERDGKQVWPGGVLDLIRHFSEHELEALLEPDLVATDVIRRYFISSQYQALIDDLERWGFHERSRPPTLYPCPYDWRRSQEVSAETLAQLLDRLAADHAGHATVTLLAHSMGGLVARYFLESGTFDTRPGFSLVQGLITVGTPHRGAPEALPVVLGQAGRLWLDRHQARTIASDPRYPSSYELLPHPGEPCAWNEGPGSRFDCVDLYDPSLAGALGLSPENLDAARRVREALRGPRAGVRYFCFSGTRQATASLVRVRRLSNTEVRLRTVEPDASGDGTVPDWSSRLPGVQCLAVGGEHGTLYKNGDVRKSLAVLLGVSEALPAAVLPPVELALRDRVTETSGRVRGVLSFPGTSAFQGELRIERAELGADGSVSFAPVGAAHAIEYRGPAADTLGVAFEAPAAAGAYRVAFCEAGHTSPAATDEMFVLERAP